MRAHLAVISFAMVGVQILVAPALADNVSRNANVAIGPTYCVNVAAAVNEDSAGAGRGVGITRSYKKDCSTAVNHDTQYISQELFVWYNKTASATPAVCVYTDFYYNSQPTWAFSLTLPLVGKAFCGAGYYEVESFGYVLVNGDWRGGSVMSGRNYLNG